MAFERSNLTRISGANSNSFAQWAYASPDDTAATINTAGYFNDASKELKAQDWLFIVDSANAHVVTYVNSNSGGVVDIADGTTISATDTD